MTTREGTSGEHEGFLRYGNFRWLKRALALAIAVMVIYAVVPAPARPYGGTWFGYCLGLVGAGLIVWLALLGIRKRQMSPGKWSLKAWTSAHVYLGLALVVVATLHTGFRFGWNLHTLAYGLTLLVVASGLFGMVVYARLPTVLSANREDQTQPQMVEGLRDIDRQLNDAAQPLPHAEAQWVIQALSESPFGAGLIARLRGRMRTSATADVLAAFQQANASGHASPAHASVEALLLRRQGQLARIRRQMQLRAQLEVWLFVHVPATIALLAALIAHVISEFYYW